MSLNNPSNRNPLEAAEKELDSLHAQMVEAIKSAQGPQKGAVRMGWEPKIQAARMAILERYKAALTQNTYDNLTSQVIRSFTDKRVKFIYTIVPTADGKGYDLRMVEEPLEPGGERPAHSELAGGRSVYAAGEIYVSDGIVVSVTNGSGHYRPAAQGTLQYVQNVLKLEGFDIAPDMKRENVKYGLVPFDDFDTQIITSVFSTASQG